MELEMNEDLSQVIGKIMANPEFGNLVTQLKNSGLAETANASTAPMNSTSQANAEKPQPKDTAAIAEMLPEIMNALHQSGVSPTSGDSANIEKAMSSLKKLDNRNCEKLLAALKPYLNNQRGEVIDKAMSVMKMTDLVALLGSTEGMK